MSALAAALAERIGADRVSTSDADRQAASRDESDLPPSLPEVVVRASSTEDVLSVVELCRTRRVPLVPRGAGSSLEGNPIPSRGGVVLDLSAMNRMLSLRAEDLLVTVEPGIVYQSLNDKLKPFGLFFPPSPGGSADVATIGGMVANNASGIYALKYGGTKRHVLGLVAVTGAGEIIRTGHRCPKASSGYDLTALLCGSEGTLAVVTEVTLSLTGRPAHSRKVALGFSDETACARAIAAMVGGGVDLAACEYLDARCMRALNAYKGYGLAESPALFLEAHSGTGPAVEDVIATAIEVCASEGGAPLVLPADPWEVRHWATRAIRALHPGTVTLRCDVAFPIGSLPDIVSLAHDLGAKKGLNLYAFGHAGLGIVHILIQESPEVAAFDRASEVKDQIVEAVIDRGGTCSGEHGIGLGNKRYMKREHGLALDVMRRVKAAFDPAGIMNPGKVLPDAPMALGDLGDLTR